MQSRNRFVVAGVVLALVLLVAQGVTAQPRNRPDRSSAGQPGWLGVSIQDVTDDIRDALPRGVTDGAIVNSVVEDSPAEEAGMKAGDIVTSFNGTAVHKADDLTAAVRDAGSGKLADIEYYRDGRRIKGRVTLAEPALSTARRQYRDALKWVQKDDGEESEEGEEGEAWMEGEPDAHAWIFNHGSGPLEFMLQSDRPARLGVRLMDLSDQLAAYFKVGSDGGALVTEVIDGSAAAKAGILAGDVIIAVEDQEVSDPGDVTEEISRHGEEGPVSVKVMRNGRTQTFTAQLDKMEKPDRRFGMRAPRMERFHFDAKEPDVRAFPAPPRMNLDRDDLKSQMKELREELKQMQKELSELRRKRP